MVEARAHELLLEQAASVRHQRSVEQRHVGGVGEHALMNLRIVGQLAGRADPYVEPAALGFLAEIAAVFDRAQLDWPLALVVALYRLGHLREHLRPDFGFARQLLGWRYLGHRHLMFEARLVVM